MPNPWPPYSSGDGDAEPAAFGERVVELGRGTRAARPSPSSSGRRTSRKFSDRSANGLLVIAQLEIHDALHSGLGLFDLRTNHTNGQTKRKAGCSGSRHPDGHAVAGNNGSTSAMRSFHAAGVPNSTRSSLARL